MVRKNNYWKVVLITVLGILGLFSFFKETIFRTGEVLAAQDFKSSSITTTIVPDEFSSLSLNSQSSSNVNQSYSVKIPVLMYHYIRDGVSPGDKEAYFLSVTPANLDAQFAFLTQNNFQTISLNDLYDSLVSHTPLPPKSVVLTFDDGYRNFYTDAFPIIKKYNLRVVSFYVVGYTSYPTYMNLDMLKEISGSGLVDVESHTLHHSDLTKLPIDQARAEIFESKRTLEQDLGKKINFFAYPYGALNPFIIKLVQEAGYKMAFGVHPGSGQNSNEIFYLRRISVTGSDTLRTFAAKVFN